MEGVGRQRSGRECSMRVICGMNVIACEMRGMVQVSFFFNDTATTEIYTLSLHDALPISLQHLIWVFGVPFPLLFHALSLC